MPCALGRRANAMELLIQLYQPHPQPQSLPPQPQLLPHPQPLPKPLPLPQQEKRRMRMMIHQQQLLFPNMKFHLAINFNTGAAELSSTFERRYVISYEDRPLLVTLKLG